MTTHYPAAEFGLWATPAPPPPIPGLQMDPDVMRINIEMNRIRYQHLTVKQRLFCDHYLMCGLNPEEGAKRAGFVPESECLRIGRRLLKNKYVEQVIDLAFLYARMRNEITPDQIAQEIKRVAFTDMSKFFKRDANGEPYVVLPEQDDPAFAAVSEITIDTYMEGRGEGAREVRKIKFKLYDKLRALDMLLKYSLRHEPDPEKADAPSGGNTSVSVINVIPVPQGHFVPASDPAALPKQTPLIEGYVTSRADYLPSDP